METLTQLPDRPEQPLHEYLRAHARERGNHPACIWYGHSMSYAELDAASDAFAARLQAIGVKKGDPVVLFLNNCPQYLAAHYGIQKIGAIVCPSGPLNKEHELAYQVNDLNARVIVAASSLLPVVDKVRGQSALAHVFVVHYADLLPQAPTLDVPGDLAAAQREPRLVPQGCEDLLAVMKSGARPAPVALSMDDVALMTYTSGTTGLPKGAMLSYGNALFKTRAAADCNGVAGSDVLLSIAPLYHIAGMLMGVNVPVLTGATSVLLHRFEPRSVLQAIERYRVSWWYSIAPMNVACMQVEGIEGFDLSSLRMNPVTSFGITFTEPLAAQWRGLAKNCASFEAAYGLSETHTCDTYTPHHAPRWGTQGIAVPGVTIRIIDPDTGADRPVGEIGEIVLTSPGSFKGYWNKPEATAATLRSGWVHTGDMGKLDADGYLTFIGRFKEMIKVSGYSVFPEEVETILIKHPAVAQAAVIAEPDAQKGEVVKAFIVRKAGAELDADALVAWARENMAPYKAPRTVRFIDALPTTGAGKVLRRLLKDHP
ncbi:MULTISPECIES: AMP-binding protein [unclassified Variovorax]|uniref:AMP-binding protein n=1 Tax=unclassified Variovorax TaxID=663243 RepID=UPI00076C03AD|nr:MULTISPECIES: AMP-binding protein [unclassified Variovorax]KWT97908.1 Long-chain-fatty-acid--CoA ligase [Variovorax sp. WDL1]PNG59254.1 Long-chain-fatty-acid--CoA ligase [Variovorax sp. B4]PNG60955.1 Long-chain-fatty-acid--CoA ligase [Variovorax sp. B2]VTV13112.1 Long-chain-fatty-acid--CoA ligase [Variovorax sp. WDL1]